jgi:general secretion pathway protein K
MIRRRDQNDRSERCAPADERGFALVLVIGVLSILALLAVAVAAESHSTALVAQTRLELARARAIGDSGLAIAVMHMFDPDPSNRWSADGISHDEQYGGGRIGITIDDEGGKLDLNDAPIEMIARLLDEFTDSDRQSMVTNAILERRAAVAANEQPVGRRFARSATPENLAKRPFADVSELQLLPGMTPALYGKVAPYLTVYSQTATFNPRTASRAVLLAIPGFEPADADALIASRTGSSDELAAEQFSKYARYAIVAPLQAATITADARLPQGTSFRRRAVIALSPDQRIETTHILRWGQAEEAESGDREFAQ